MNENVDWSDEIFSILLEQRIKQVAYVPDAGHKKLIERVNEDNYFRDVPLTSEEEGVALLSGAWLGDERGVLLMQSSGVGNIINMLSISVECRFPLFMIITMRGEWGEFNPWQVPMGKATQSTLEAMDVKVIRVDVPDKVAETVAAGIKLTFDSGRMVAVLIGQRVIGSKDWNR
ncbi:MAG: phosphonopyruvate decarboxylase [Rhodospirillaceae bacterium]|nr:phosphonopyruvate decarboxylase [Rhodospirillaceae bacterium]|tara:strand:- start:4505 stop:5026 length:522 start_codon:yes stop_codon:yes gene_type:complete